jgi:predicted 2-oxoglutarate/Fe(II)-dependent dioxygenase YbiX
MKMNLQDYIAIYNINNYVDCKNIIRLIESGGWQKHSYNNPVTNENTTYEDDLDVSYQDKATTDLIKNVVTKFVKDYITTVASSTFSLQDLSEPRFNRYEVGANMKPHVDHIHTMFDGERKGVPILTVLGLLNDDFEGGDFLMFDNKKVNLEAGDVIIFPSNFLYPHSVTTVTKGTRYSFVSWGY